MPGWIALWRNIRQHWIWEDSKRFQRWIDLLLMAQWDPVTVSFCKTNVKLERGQLVTSLRVLAHLWQTNVKTVRIFLYDLELYGMISRVSNKKMTVITIVNWEKYQAIETAVSPMSEHKRKQKGQQKREPIKQIEEDNKINIIPSTLREDEEKFYEEIKSSDVYKENVCKALKCDQDKFLELLEDFRAEMRAVEKFHNSLTDCKTHFLHWARIAINKKQNQNGNGTRQKPGATASDKHASRRGTEPSDFKKKDYSKGF